MVNHDRVRVSCRRLCCAATGQDAADKTSADGLTGRPSRSNRQDNFCQSDKN